MSKHLNLIVGLTVILGAAFGAFLFLDNRDEEAHKPDLIEAEASLYERILMSDSTRYAEIQKYYIDKMKSGESLTEAEQARLDLVMRQQERIANTLKKDQ